jgi:hypothetical protein
MSEHTASLSASDARLLRMGGASRKRRTVFWTIVFATIASLGLWGLIALSAQAVLGALFA